MSLLLSPEGVLEGASAPSSTQVRLDVTVWSDTFWGHVCRSTEGDQVMAKRFKIAHKKSKKMFSRNADRTHKKNLPAPRRNPMRGGIRL